MRDHIIFHCGTNDLNSEKSASQIARPIIKLALLVKSNDNKILISNYCTKELQPQ